MKTILVDAWNTFVTKEGLFQEMKKLLDEYENTKIILTNANEEEKVKLGIVNMPYKIFSLSHNPDKVNPKYYETMLKHFDIKANEVIYFEHNEDAVKSATSVGITTYHYDKEKRDLAALKKFINKTITL